MIGACYGEGSGSLVALVLVFRPAVTVVTLEGVRGTACAHVASAAQSVSATTPLVEQTAAGLVGSLKKILFSKIMDNVKNTCGIRQVILSTWPIQIKGYFK